MGVFTVTMYCKFMIDFCQMNDLSSLIDKPTCYKIFDKFTWIDLILTNKPSYFQRFFQNLNPQAKTYLNYKTFDNDKFQAVAKTWRIYLPIRNKYICTNEVAFIKKNLHKEILKWSR